jgi:hypothetical protein
MSIMNAPDTLTVSPAVASLMASSIEGGGGSVPSGGSTKQQLDVSLEFDLRGANGSMGLGEHVGQGQTNRASRRLPPSEDFAFDRPGTAPPISWISILAA